jgi:hypothetical protein
MTSTTTRWLPVLLVLALVGAAISCVREVSLDSPTVDASRSSITIDASFMPDAPDVDAPGADAPDVDAPLADAAGD